MNAKKIMPSLALAASIIAISLGLTWAAKTGAINADLPARITMALSGLIIAFYGNAIPKAFIRSANGIAARRFAGWAFVLSGLATAAAWALAPTDLAATISLATLGATVLLVLATCLLSERKGPSAQ